jgi:formylglycine-generating enzyme required for sulfatase activity
MSSIFLSHSSQDNLVAEQVKARLEQWGHRSIFLDFDPANGIPAGRDWEKELYAKLRECRALIILCSHASMASRWCFAEITHAKAMGRPVFPIKLDDAQVDRVLTSVQIIDATTGWDAAYQRLEKGLLAAGLDPKNLFDWDTRRPPYPGLPAFQEQDAAIFFGRDEEIREGQALLNRLRQFGGPRLTLMLGASGSGKSSLMRAGLLPRLKRDSRWIVVEPFRPLKAPFDELATVLSERLSRAKQAEKGTSPDVAYVRDRIRWGEHEAEKSVDAFLELIKTLRETSVSQEATLLLMIDQCEELLAGGADNEGDRFLAFLRAVIELEDSRLMVLATLRSDFLGLFQNQPAMRGLKVETFPVPQMAVDDFASVIEGPARIAGLELGPGLVQAMISDTKTSDALPLLAFTLRELYEGFGEDKLLTLEEYRDKLGRLEGCIARAAEAVLTAKPLSEEKLSALRTSFLLMVRVADSDQYAKQPVLWNDLPASIHDVLEGFVTARLLISGGDKNGRTLEVAHDALFRAWPRLVGWLEDNKSFLVWQQRLNAAVKEWEGTKRRSDLLLRGLPLTEAVDWHKKRSDDFSSVEREFVTASINRKQRNRRDAGALAGLVLTVVGMTVWLWGYSRDQAVLKVQSKFMSIHLLPEIQPVAAGNFEQGDKHGRGTGDEKPVHKVRVKSFAMGKFEVTFDEYDRFALATGRDLPGDQRWGRGRQPVINVSWQDANAYADWLSIQTKRRYRLPTESEWEYAARSEGKDDLWAGTSDEKRLADYAVYAANSQNRTASVGKDPGRQPNAIGLYDMSGNVYEWVEDCVHENYNEAPTDGSAWLEANAGNCKERVHRGGSLVNDPVSLRVSSRNWHVAVLRYYTIGFRLAQDIP